MGGGGPAQRKEVGLAAWLRLWWCRAGGVVQDTKLSEAMQIMSVYVTHLSEHKQAMDAEVKRLRTRINTLEKR